MSKLDNTKPKMSYLYSSALFAMAKVREKAMEKYPNEEDWRTTPSRVHYDAAFRHLFAAMEREWLDPESGEPHLAHAMCNLMFLIESHNNPKQGTDDDIISKLIKERL